MLVPVDTITGMSITIMINNGEQYIEQNHPELIEVDRYDDEDYGVAEFKRYPFEMQVANANHSMLWNALGLEWDYCGHIHPMELLKALDGVNPALMERSVRVDGSHYFCGVDAEQVESYVYRLRVLSIEAVNREENVCWG
jgi:hypothetical protein